MASSSSFDIVCEMNLQEVTNAVDQARREVANRYDFRGSKCEIELDRQDNSLRLTADDEMKMQTLIDVLLTKLVKREVPTKALVYGKTEPSGKVLKKQISVQNGLSKDQCKEGESDKAFSHGSSQAGTRDCVSPLTSCKP